ncbi:hypothetical protein OH492_11320 [Vibrio chagasii]|nr:hypothetical protein [Vibrio chagasii]
MIRLAIGVFAVMIIIPFVENKPCNDGVAGDDFKLTTAMVTQRNFVGTFLALVATNRFKNVIRDSSSIDSDQSGLYSGDLAIERRRSPAGHGAKTARW